MKHDLMDWNYTVPKLSVKDTYLAMSKMTDHHILAIGLYGLSQIREGEVIDITGEPTDALFKLNLVCCSFETVMVTNGDEFQLIVDDMLVAKCAAVPAALKPAFKKLFSSFDFEPLILTVSSGQITTADVVQINLLSLRFRVPKLPSGIKYGNHNNDYIYWSDERTATNKYYQTWSSDKTIPYCNDKFTLKEKFDLSSNIKCISNTYYIKNEI